MAITRESITPDDIQVVFWNHLRQPLGSANWSQMTFSGTEVLNGVGTWRMTAPAAWRRDWLAKNSITADKDVAGISVFLRGQFMFSGPISASTVTVAKDGVQEELVGVTDSVMMADTIWTPLNGRKSTTKIGQAVFVSDPHACLREALELQWGTPAQAAGYPIHRQQSAMLDWANSVYGTSAKLASLPLDSTGTLLEVMQAVAQFDDGLTCFRLRHSVNTLIFESWEGNDLTSDINLTVGAGDLDEVTQTAAAPRVTAMWVDRGMEKSEPVMIANSAWSSRARVFGRGTIEGNSAWSGEDANLAERTHLAYEQLLEANRNSTTATCRIGGNTRFMLGNDYRLGDKIAVTAGGLVYNTGQVSEIRLGVTSTGADAWIQVESRDEPIWPVSPI